MKDAELVSLAEENRVIAVVRADSADLAFRAAEAAIVGGITLIEVGLATPGSYRVISDLCHKYGDKATVGVGSVINYDQIDRAVKAGAQFVGMPHTNSPLVEACRRQRVPPIIGALTPTEVAIAWGMAVPMVMLFPASAAGGADYVHAMTSRFTDVRLGAAGGVSPENIVEHLEAGAFAVAVGKHLFTSDDLRNEDFAAISDRARRLAELASA
jgi:2-dehydro-3-deoxyphosphogluconate aldolase/(4S)-4-hydroxy-2-oxoglutarate aldolase